MAHGSTEKNEKKKKKKKKSHRENGLTEINDDDWICRTHRQNGAYIQDESEKKIHQDINDASKKKIHHPKALSEIDDQSRKKKEKKKKQNLVSSSWAQCKNQDIFFSPSPPIGATTGAENQNHVSSPLLTISENQNRVSSSSSPKMVAKPKNHNHVSLSSSPQKVRSENLNLITSYSSPQNVGPENQNQFFPSEMRSEDQNRVSLSFSPKKARSEDQKLVSSSSSSKSSLKKARSEEEVHENHAKTINGDASAITKNHKQMLRPFTRAMKTDLSLRHRRDIGRWGCIDTCCWVIGYICCLWWMLLVLYKALPSLSEAISGPLPDPPGLKLKKEGIQANHPVVFIPGIVTGGLELWEGHPCADGLFRQRLWGGSFGDVYKRPFCWMEHMALDNVTGLDPPGVRVRPVSGLVAADYFASFYFVWAILIENLAKIGYEEKNLHMAAYDWRLSFQNTELRDKTLSRLKSTIELLVQTNEGKKVVAVPHSMGTLYFLHFMKWVEAPAPMGGGGGPDWCAKHIKAVMNIAGPLLGVPKAVAGLFSAEAKDIAVARAIAPMVLDSEMFSLQTLQHIMRMTRSWDSTMSMIPKGGEVIWGGTDWSPEEGFQCPSRKREKDEVLKELGPHGKPMAHYGRLLSFGKDTSEAPSYEINRKHFKEVKGGLPLSANLSCGGDVWTEYHELSWDSIQAVADHKVYTANDVSELLRYVAPAMMQRGDAQFSHGLADDLDDPKYQHYKYWSNPLETRLPDAPEMEIYCMYGVGILTERSYIYKVFPQPENCRIPFRIDSTAEGDSEGCLKGGVRFVDGDETVPALSAGFMCAKGWDGKTRFNPSGAATFVREYNHSPPANLLEGRGTQSGAHVDIMGNLALIEDILRVAAGASGDEIGGNQIHSDLLKWVERIDLKLQ